MLKLDGNKKNFFLFILENTAKSKKGNSPVYFDYQNVIYLEILLALVL